MKEATRPAAMPRSSSTARRQRPLGDAIGGGRGVRMICLEAGSPSSDRLQQPPSTVASDASNVPVTVIVIELESLDGWILVRHISGHLSDDRLLRESKASHFM